MPDIPTSTSAWTAALATILNDFQSLALGLHNGVSTTSATASADFDQAGLRAAAPQRPKAATGHAAMRQCRFDIDAAPLATHAAALLAGMAGRPWESGRITLSVPRGRPAYIGGRLRTAGWDFRLHLGFDAEPASALLDTASAIPALTPHAVLGGWSITISSLTRAMKLRATPLQRQTGIFQQFETIDVDAGDAATAVRSALIQQSVTARLIGKPPRALLIGTVGSSDAGRADEATAAEAAAGRRDAASALLAPVLRHPWRPDGVLTFHQALNARLPQAPAPAV